MIFNEAGKDATEKFNQIHSIDIIHQHLTSSEYIGEIDPISLASYQKSRQNTKNENKPESKIPPSPPLLSILNAEEFTVNINNNFLTKTNAKKVLSLQAWAYFSSGSNDEYTLANNTQIFKQISLIPRVLKNVTIINTKTCLFTKETLPFYISSCALGKLAHPLGEVALTLAAGKKDIIQMIPT